MVWNHLVTKKSSIVYVIKFHIPIFNKSQGNYIIPHHSNLIWGIFDRHTEKIIIESKWFESSYRIPAIHLHRNFHLYVCYFVFLCYSLIQPNFFWPFLKIPFPLLCLKNVLSCHFCACLVKVRTFKILSFQISISFKWSTIQPFERF